MERGEIISVRNIRYPPLPQDNEVVADSGLVVSDAITEEDWIQEIDDGNDKVSDGVFARLRLVGLL